MLGILQEPHLGRERIERNLVAREALGRDHKQRALRPHPLQHLDQMAAVDIAHEMRLQGPRGAVGPQGLGDHVGAGVEGAHANVHNVRDALARVAAPLAPPHRPHKRLHFAKHLESHVSFIKSSLFLCVSNICQVLLDRYLRLFKQTFKQTKRLN